jgi:hypothetical protein
MLLRSLIPIPNTLTWATLEAGIILRGKTIQAQKPLM